jgi:hypothetical protein
MSTISLPYEKQIRHFFVADAIATETNIQDFIASASIGEMQIFDQEGNAIDYTSGALVGKDFYLAKKNNKGGISKTDMITPKDITYLKGTKPVAKTGKTQTFTLGAAPTVGKEYMLVGKVHYGNSEENFITFWAGDIAKTGDTATTLLSRIAKQMADNLAASVNTAAKANAGEDTIEGTTKAKKNKYFTLSVAGSTLTVTEKDWILDDFRVGLRTHDQLMFNFELQSADEQDNITKGGTAPVYAKGQGYQMIELERFLVGHRAETTDTLDSTLGFGRNYDTDIAQSYHVLDMKYFDVSRDSEKHSDKMLTITSTDPKVIDAIGFAIEASMGKSEGTAWTELDPAADGADNVV